MVKKTITVTLVPEISQCAWDSEKMALTTPRDEYSKQKKAQGETGWYHDFFTKTGAKKKAPAFKTSEEVWNVNGATSVTVTTLKLQRGKEDNK